MFRVVLASVLIAAAGAHRIHVVDQSESKTKFGSTCDGLRTRFHSRVAAFQASVDTLPDVNSIGRLAQARLMMRTHGILRTLRRARTCSWVTQNDSDELEQVRGITQTLLAGNLCADDARYELQSGLAAETEEAQLMSIQRAASVLMSDTCDPTELPEPEQSGNDDADVALAEAEDNLSFAIEGVEEGESSFIQTNSDARSLRSFLRGVGVAFLVMFLLLACVAATVVIVFFLTLGLTVLIAHLTHSRELMQIGWIFPVFTVPAGGALGLVGCAISAARLFL